MIGLDDARDKTVRYRQDSVDEQVRALLNCTPNHNTTSSTTELLDGGLTVSAYSARAGARPTLVCHFTVSCDRSLIIQEQMSLEGGVAGVRRNHNDVGSRAIDRTFFDPGGDGFPSSDSAPECCRRDHKQSTADLDMCNHLFDRGFAGLDVAVAEKCFGRGDDHFGFPEWQKFNLVPLAACNQAAALRSKLLVQIGTEQGPFVTLGISMCRP